MPPFSLLLLSISSTIAPITSVLVFPLHLPLLSHLLQACPTSTYFSHHYRCYSTRAHTSPTSPPLFYPLSDTLSPAIPIKYRRAHTPTTSTPPITYIISHITGVTILPLLLPPLLYLLSPNYRYASTAPTSTPTLVPTIPPIIGVPLIPLLLPPLLSLLSLNYRRAPTSPSFTPTIVPTIPPNYRRVPTSPSFTPTIVPTIPPNYRRVPITQSDSLKTRRISFFARTTIWLNPPYVAVLVWLLGNGDGTVASKEIVRDFISFYWTSVKKPLKWTFLWNSCSLIINKYPPSFLHISQLEVSMKIKLMSNSCRFHKTPKLTTMNSSICPLNQIKLVILTLTDLWPLTLLTCTDANQPEGGNSNIRRSS